MPESFGTALVFAMACAALFTLPFIPALREWRRPTDRDPLPVPANQSSDIDHFAVRLRADALARLGRGTSTGYEEFEFIGAQAAPTAWAQARGRLLAMTDVQTHAAIRTSQPLYVDGSVQAGAHSAFASVYAAHDLELGEGSQIADWAHADGELRLGAGSSALRRISAGVAVKLAAQCCFERVHAPAVRLGVAKAAVVATPVPEQQPDVYAGLPHAIERTPLLYMVRGDCALPEHRIYRGSLVVTGFLSIGAGTTVIGDIKARGGVSLGEGAVVQGAITCEKRVHMYPGSLALGPVVCEDDVLLGARSVVGLTDALTTVSARSIVAEEGAVVHGTLWAHEIGMVKSA